MRQTHEGVSWWYQGIPLGLSYTVIISVPVLFPKCNVMEHMSMILRGLYISKYTVLV